MLNEATKKYTIQKKMMCCITYVNIISLIFHLQIYHMHLGSFKETFEHL